MLRKTAQMNFLCKILFTLLSSVFLCAFIACEGKEPIAAGDDDDDNDNDSDDDDDDDDDIFDDDDMFDDDDDDDDNDDNNSEDEDNDTEVCDEWNIDIEVVPTRLMLLQDISSSMNQGTPQKWEQAQGALNFILDEFGDSEESGIEFGFDTFPNPGSADNERCLVTDPVVVDADSGTTQEIRDFISSLSLSRSTPLYVAMEEYTREDYAPKFLSKDVASYIVLISDGADSCGTNGQGQATAQQLGDLAAKLHQDHEVMTFAIGFGSDASLTQLNAIAQNGGTPYDEALNAQDQDQLEDVLKDIAAVVASCIYDIGDVEDGTDKNKVNFFFNGGDIELKYDEGCKKGGLTWTWVDDDKTRVQFCDEACDMLKNGEVEDIYAEFGCDTVIVD